MLGSNAWFESAAMFRKLIVAGRDRVHAEPVYDRTAHPLLAAIWAVAGSGRHYGLQIGARSDAEPRPPPGHSLSLFVTLFSPNRRYPARAL